MQDSVVSADWLANHLEDATVTIVDCRFALMQPDLGGQQYQQGHIPGAYYLDLNRDLSSPVGSHGGRHPLPDLATLAEKLGSMGVSSASPKSLVVAYDDSRQAFAARLWWLLRYLGHDRVAVLDGGWSGWLAAGYPQTRVIPDPKPAQFIPQVRAEWVLDLPQVKARQGKPGTVLVDAREGERYRGEREPIDPVAGHIPGAINYPWQDTTDPAGKLRSPEEQRQRWQDLAPGSEIVVYCGSGVTACVNLLSLELAGIRNGKLYAGSWSDWCSYADNPIAREES